MSLILLSCQWGADAVAETQSGTIWVTMENAGQEKAQQGIVQALALRLPSWQIVAVDADAPRSVPCRKATGQGRYVLMLIETAGELKAGFYVCGQSESLWEEPIGREADSVETAYRQTAALVRLTVATGESLESDGQTGISVANGDSAAAANQGRGATKALQGTISLIPGLSVAPRAGDAVFSGGVMGGVLLRNHLWIEAGVLASTSHDGEADKNSNDDRSDIAVRVQETTFRASLKYQLQLSERWWTAVGLGLSYTHFVKRDLLDDKFAIDEENPAARGAAAPDVAVAFAPLPLLSMVFSVAISISFGARKFKVRGEDAVDLGTLSLFAGLGLVFVL